MDLFLKAGIQLPDQVDPNKADLKADLPKSKKPKAASVPPVLPDVADVHEGFRNIFVFESTRWHFYPATRGEDLAAWRGRVWGYAEDLNRQLSRPLSPGEIKKLALGVANWIWTGMAKFDHSQAAQFRRGVKRQYKNAKKATLIAVKTLHQDVREMRKMGLKQYQIAAAAGFTQQRVSALTSDVDVKAARDAA